MNTFQFKKLLFLFLFLISAVEISAMIDNRYLPLYRPEYTRYPCKKSVFGSNVFFLFSSEGRSHDGSCVKTPEINGKYDLSRIAKALTIVGEENPLSPQWQTLNRIPWQLKGKIEGEGFWFGYEQAIGDLSLGVSIYALKVISKQALFLPEDTIRELRLGKGGEATLRQDQLLANKLLGIESLQFNKFGLADIDLYARYGIVKDYVNKFRKIDLSVTLGTLLPTSPKLNINIPSSIPFGGNGHYGLYGRTDVILELKDDLTVGFWLEVCKRFSKNQKMRLPVNNELIDYGALIADIRVKPGVTVGFQPFVALTDIQDGIGIRAGYTLIHHDEDQLTDLRKDKKITIPIEEIADRSGWLTQYVNLRLMYDFSKAVHNRTITPLLYIDWDMPVGLFESRNIGQTNRISLGFEFNF
ncbi:MAG: hypothetical protein P4L22_03135 [Candidatus Babeliales bacterium]|nr:hypothetical protein [Candidatus Babeliales bacterium]